jgi:hypothetical protein
MSASLAPFAAMLLIAGGSSLLDAYQAFGPRFGHLASTHRSAIFHSEEVGRAFFYMLWIPPRGGGIVSGDEKLIP